MSNKEIAVSRFQTIFGDLIERLGDKMTIAENHEHQCDLLYVHAESGTEFHVNFRNDEPHQVEMK